MEAQYEKDPGNATEIVLKLPRRWRNANAGATAPESKAADANVDAGPPPEAPTASSQPASARTGPPYPRARGGSSGRAAAGALRLANTVGAAISNRRVLGRSESGPLLIAGILLLVAAVVGIVWPRLVAWPLAVLALWIGVSLIARYIHTYDRRP
jgi:cardiolipin synthase